MDQAIRKVGVFCASVALICALAGCGSDSATEPTSSQAASVPAAGPAAPGAGSTVPPPGAAPPEGAPPAAPAPHNYAIKDFIRDLGLAETQLHPGDAGAPRIDLPVPPGWSDAGGMTPAFAWSAILFTDPAMSADPPNIVTIVSKLTGNAASRVLAYAPGELANMTDFEGPEGMMLKVSGFSAWQRGGTFTRSDGVKRAIVQTSVVFPAPDGEFIMQQNADGLPDQLGLLTDTMRVVNEQTTITP